MVEHNVEPTEVEEALILAASAAIDMASDAPLVQIATRGPGEETTLVILACLIPADDEAAVLHILGAGVDHIAPAIEKVYRVKPELDS